MYGKMEVIDKTWPDVSPEVEAEFQSFCSQNPSKISKSNGCNDADFL